MEMRKTIFPSITYGAKIRGCLTPLPCCEGILATGRSSTAAQRSDHKPVRASLYKLARTASS